MLSSSAHTITGSVTSPTAGGGGIVVVVAGGAATGGALQPDLGTAVPGQGLEGGTDRRGVVEPGRPVPQKVGRVEPIAGGRAGRRIEDPGDHLHLGERGLDPPPVVQSLGPGHHGQHVRGALALDGVDRGLHEHSGPEVVDEQHLVAQIGQQAPQRRHRGALAGQHGGVGLDDHGRATAPGEQAGHAPQGGHLRALDVHLDHVEMVPSPGRRGGGRPWSS